MEKNKGSVSRRDFLKTAGLTAGGIGATALAATAKPAEAFFNNPAKDNVISTSTSSITKTMTAAVQPIAAASPPSKWDYETDVVVVGTGGAGGSATVTALEAGAKVVTLEKLGIWGGNMQFSGMFSYMWWYADDSKWRGGKPEYNPYPASTVPSDTLGAADSAAAAKYETTAARYYRLNTQYGTFQADTRNPAVVRKLGEQLEELTDWITSLGVKWIPAVGTRYIEWSPMNPASPTNYSNLTDPINRAAFMDWFPFNTRGITEALKTKAETYAGKTWTMLYDTPVMSLVKSGSDIVGVKAEKADGTAVYIKASAVVLATGGFSANTEMLQYYWSAERLAYNNKYWGQPGATGDGIRLGQGVGAAISNMDGEADWWDGGACDPEKSNGPRSVYSAANQLTRQGTLIVNKRGERFMNEGFASRLNTVYHYRAMMKSQQPDNTSFPLFDANCISKADVADKFHSEFCTIPCNWFDDDFAAQLASGVIIKANSLTELAGKMGLDASATATFLKNVAQYNALCDTGVDTDFYKSPKYLHKIETAPFYTVKSVGVGLMETYGGLRVNENMNVVDATGAPIPRLYVAGESAAMFSEVCRATGTGRLAAKAILKDILGK